jgi:hypothetical protein
LKQKHWEDKRMEKQSYISSATKDLINRWLVTAGQKPFGMRVSRWGPQREAMALMWGYLHLRHQPHRGARPLVRLLPRGTHAVVPSFFARRNQRSTFTVISFVALHRENPALGTLIA